MKGTSELLVPFSFFRVWITFGQLKLKSDTKVMQRYKKCKSAENLEKSIFF